MWALSHRGQHKELRLGEGQIRLLCPGPHWAVLARGGHHQDPQEGTNGLVEGRSLRPGETSKTSSARRQNIQILRDHLVLLVSASTSRWGCFHPTMWRRITLITAKMCQPALNVKRFLWVTALSQMHECEAVCVKGNVILLLGVQWCE